MPKNVLRYSFPPAEQADENGIVAIGGNLDSEHLLAAYERGIFPWPHADLPLLWFCPDPRFVLYPREIHLSKSLVKKMRRSPLMVRADRNFGQVIRQCAQIPRPDQPGTWINEEIMSGYRDLHALGYAHSIEAYNGEKLVGGLYGVSLGKTFFGESMFTLEADAAKIAFTCLVAQLIKWKFHFIDCQAHTRHLERFGAKFVARKQFLSQLRNSLKRSSKIGEWNLELTPIEAVEYINAHAALHHR